MYKFFRHIVDIKLIGMALVFIFLSVLSFSLFHMPANMGMVESTSDCPFMEHGESLCAMNVVGHLGAWQSAFLAVVPIFLLLMLAVVGAVILYSRAPHLLINPSRRLFLLYRYYINRVYLFSSRPLQELFSNGILHPKLF